MHISKPKEILSMDLRSIAALRIGVAFVILMDLWIRSRYLIAHYTDAGILPREALETLASNPWFWSFHSLSGGWLLQIILFTLAAIFSLGLLLGFSTRVCTIASFVLLISLQNRNTMILEGADVMLRVILFWGIFLPWERRFSVDARLREDPSSNQNSHFSWGLIGFTLQIVLIYLFTALLKSGDEWTQDGSALWFAFSLDLFAKPFGKFLLELPKELLVFLTFSSRWFEMFGSFLLFIPIYKNFFRMTAVIAFIGFHLFIWLTFSVGWFSWIGVAAWVAFLPGWFWERKVVLRMTESLNGILTGIATGITKFSGKRFKALSPLRESTGLKIIAGFFSIYILLWNIGTLENSTIGVRNFNWIGKALRLDQFWVMFAPYPDKDDGWFVVEGYTAEGRSIDGYRFIMTGEVSEALPWEKPEHVYRMYPTSRWQKYMSRLWLRADRDHRPYFADYVCREWNKKYGMEEPLQSLTLTYMLERTLKYKDPIVEKEFVYSQNCSE